MTGQVNPATTRRYDAAGRRRAAAATRERVLAAARQLFLHDGYRATTVVAVARRAGVSPDTVYASVGTKAALFRLLVERALSGATEPVPGPARGYAVAMREAPAVVDKLRIYAAAVTEIQGRLAPLFLVLREGAAADAELAALWSEVTERRARTMRELAADLAASGQVRYDLTLEEVADVVWTMNSAEYYSQLVLQRGWTAQRFQDWLHDAWCRLLVDPTAEGPSPAR